MFSLYKTGKNKYYVIHTLSGAKHSDKALSYHAARAQLRALNSIYNGTQLHPLDILGGSFLDDLKTKAKNVFGRVKSFITGDRGYKPLIQKLLTQYGDKQITGITIIREPIKQYVNILTNIITLGEIDKYKNTYNINELFHLYMIVALNDGSLIRVEKNEEIDIEKVNSIPQLDPKFVYVCKLPSNNLTLNILLNKTLNTIGQARYFKYDALNNNCQNYLYNILSTNGFNSINPDMKQFIIQDLTQLANKLGDTTKDIMNGLTNIKKRINIITGGSLQVHAPARRVNEM